MVINFKQDEKNPQYAFINIDEFLVKLTACPFVFSSCMLISYNY